MANYRFDPKKYIAEFRKIFEEIIHTKKWNRNTLRKLLTKFPKDGKGIFSKDQLVSGYRLLIQDGIFKEDPAIIEKIQMKPTRTISGVAPLTVLTKPYPCPGKCIFCPDDVRMPKSYLSSEPGAQRAERNQFDPYLQTYNRLLTFQNIGHGIEKVELIILGGTWSYYPEEYQKWFIKRCLDAMNDFDEVDRRSNILSFKEETWEELFQAQERNEQAKSRCVGLVVETRPDHVDIDEIIKMRKLGVTKVQIGIQSLDDTVLLENQRGHTISDTKNAIKLLRMAGFKIHAHWMPNLYGSTVKNDIQDYKKLWRPEYCPDELKIYPTSIIKNTKLERLFKAGKFTPYSYDELLEVLTEAMKNTPRYCRLTRVMRDIPSADIVSGNKFSNFRQIAESKLIEEGNKCVCIRCREVRDKKIKQDEPNLNLLSYETSVGEENFISFDIKDEDKIVGFLRLQIPERNVSNSNIFKELIGCSIIREVHVYGSALDLGKKTKGKSQHIGLGKKLIKKAVAISKQHGYKKIAVISAIGTREYYRKLGFKREGLYMTMRI